MNQASTAAIAAVLLTCYTASFPIVAFAQTGGTTPSRPSSTQTCKACVLDLSSCLRRCNEKNSSTSDRLRCVNTCTEKQRCVRGVTCTPNSS